MLRFALMNENVVSNIIAGESLEAVAVLGTCIEISEESGVGIGYIYDKETNTFSYPVPLVVTEAIEEPVVEPIIVTE